MKTLKKTLCLVLAVVMVVGALVLPASAAYKDVDKIDKDYTAAVTSLTTWKIMEGENNNFKPEASIQRQEMAAIVYRMLTGDIKDADGKDNSAIYAPYAAKFTDVDTKGWAAGYIGFCVNKGIILGTNTEGTTFEPARAIPAVDVLAMLLRCLGYTQKDEFTGVNWSQKVASAATRLGLTKGITRTLDKVSQRQEVAQMTYQASQAARVTWSESEQNYIPYINPNEPGSTGNSKLVTETAVAAVTAATRDQWGGVSGGKSAGTDVTFNYPVPAVTKHVVLPAAVDSVLKSWVVPVSQCDFAKALGLEKTTTFDVYTNGIENRTTVSVDPLNTTAQIGAQGRYTAVYKNPAFVSTASTPTVNPYIIVYKDTLLAKVTNVKAHTVDAQGHVKTKASLELKIFIGPKGTFTAPVISSAVSGDAGVVVKTLTSKTDFTYAKGDYVLLNFHQADTLGTDGYLYTKTAAPYAIRVDNTDWAKNQKYIAATTKFTEGNTVMGDWNGDEDYDINDFVTIVDKAGSFTGSQTLVSSNSNKHTIDGTAYNDNNRYVLDEAVDKMKTPFTWYTDKNGNVIGSTLLATSSSYGVITRMWAAIDSADGSTTVKANVTYMDGTTQTVNVANVSYVAGDTVGTQITATTGLATGAATYTDTSADGKVMKASGNKFYVSDSYNVNKAADVEGIMLKHLFKITASKTPGAYDFTEVAGKGNTLDAVKGLANATTAITSGKATNGDVKVDNDTVFLIRSVSGSSYTFTSVTGYKTIDSYVSGEVDYVDCDEDDAAEYVYIIAGKKGAEGWHLFYAASTVTSDANGSKALVHVDKTDKNYTVWGYLDGVAGSVTIRKDQKGWDSSTDTGTTKNDPTKWHGAALDTVLASGENGNTLWIVYIKDGYVIDINGAINNKSGTTMTAVNSGTIYTTPRAFSGNPYGMGMRTGCPYGSDPETQGVYAKQSVMVTTLTKQADFTTSSGTITLNKGAANEKTLTIVDPIVGDWADLQSVGDEDASGNAISYTVIAVYDEKDVITQAYIYNNNAGTNYEGGGNASTVKYELHDLEAAYADGKVTVEGQFRIINSYFANKSTVTIKVQLQQMNSGVANGWTDLGKAVEVKTVACDRADYYTNRGFEAEIEWASLVASNTYQVVVTATYSDAVRDTEVVSVSIPE